MPEYLLIPYTPTYYEEQAEIHSRELGIKVTARELQLADCNTRVYVQTDNSGFEGYRPSLCGNIFCPIPACVSSRIKKKNDIFKDLRYGIERGEIAIAKIPYFNDMTSISGIDQAVGRWKQLNQIWYNSFRIEEDINKKQLRKELKINPDAKLPYNKESYYLFLTSRGIYLIREKTTIENVNTTRQLKLFDEMIEGYVNFSWIEEEEIRDYIDKTFKGKRRYYKHGDLMYPAQSIRLTASVHKQSLKQESKFMAKDSPKRPKERIKYIDPLEAHYHVFDEKWNTINLTLLQLLKSALIDHDKLRLAEFEEYFGLINSQRNEKWYMELAGRVPGTKEWNFIRDHAEAYIKAMEEAKEARKEERKRKRAEKPAN